MSDQGHELSYKNLIYVLIALLVLTGITILASTIHLGPFNTLVALAIASTKCTLVLLYFMHLKFEPPFFRYSFIATILTLATFISFTFWDISFRTGVN